MFLYCRVFSYESHFLSLLLIHLFFFAYVVYNGEELLTFSSYCRVEFLVILS